MTGYDYTGLMFLNGKDAWLTWNTFLVGDSEDNLLLPPPPKEYVSNDFRSQDGTQVFIINPRKQSREVQLEFCIMANSRNEYLIKYKDLVNELSNGMITLNVPSLGEEYNLIVSNYLSLGYYIEYGKLLVRFNESYSVPVTVDVLGTESMSEITTEYGESILI